MARFATFFALASAVAILAFAGPALATEARYTCSDGSKLSRKLLSARRGQGERRADLRDGA